jgi:hypothetical protein
MKLKSVAAVLEAMNRENVRVIVAGGLAVNAHGYLRVTKDADPLNWSPEISSAHFVLWPAQVTGLACRLLHASSPT